MKRTILFLAAGIAAVSVAVACQDSVRCMQHQAEAEFRRMEQTRDLRRCYCIYQHEIDDYTGRVCTIKRETDCGGPDV